MILDRCICITLDGEPGELVTGAIVKARKEHRCVECGETISPGSQYERVTGLWDGEFATFKTCLTCRNVRNSLFVCEYNHGTLWQDIRDAFEEQLPEGETDDFDWLL